MSSRRHDLLPPAASRLVQDALRPRAESLVNQDHLQLTTPGDQFETEAREAENQPQLDFANVRVHTDARAAESARALGARAYTIGRDIVFAPGQFAPHQPEGRRLAAHELAHARQPQSEQRLARAPAPTTEYETAGLDITRAEIEPFAAGSYWETKLGEKYDIKYQGTVQSRLKSDAEERDAVFSTVWQRQPTGKIASDTSVTVQIPARAADPKSKQVLYQYTYRPPATGATLPGLLIDLKGEDAAATLSAAPAPPPGYTAPSFRANSTTGFPGGDRDKYFAAHPDEHKQLTNWIGNAPAKFNQFVTTSETAGGKKHESTFQLIGDKDATGKLTSLALNLISESAPIIDNPPAGYATKDLLDLELEKRQAKASDKLGKVDLGKAPVDEQLSVKYVIQHYFDTGTRNREVDVIIPIAKKTNKVYYTLRFRPTTNDVDVERIGEEDSSVNLKPQALNIGRVEGFAANSKDATTFQAWIKSRYPGVAVSGATLPDMQDSVNKDMTANAGSPAWFSKNYSIEILDATAAEARLKATHQRSAAELVDLKAFDADDLKRLEYALETMSDAELKLVKDVRFARQSKFLELSGSTVTPKPTIGGWTWRNGSDSTVIIFDGATPNDKSLFIGGSAGVRAQSVQTYAHELGHVLGGKNKIESAFQAFVAKKKIAPITKYAISKPNTESFPEAFSIFQTDPEWMQSNLPDLYTWFDTVKKTGSPPTP